MTDYIKGSRLVEGMVCGVHCEQRVIFLLKQTVSPAKSATAAAQHHYVTSERSQKTLSALHSRKTHFHLLQTPTRL